MSTDDVFDLLVEANPVPDPHSTCAETAKVVPLRPIDTGSEPMKTIEPTTLPIDRPRRTRRSWIGAAAAAVIVLVGIGALLITTSGDDPEPVDVPVTTPASTSPPTTAAPATAPPTTAPPNQVLGPEDEPAAAAAAESFYSSVLAGDVDAVVAMSNPDTNLVADEAMWEMNGYVFANSDPPTVGNCHSLFTSSQIIDAGCDVTVTDPVWQSLGAPDEMIFPIRYFADGTAQWLPFRLPDDDTSGFDISRVNRAIVEYLREMRPADYEAVCSPNGYETGTINQDQGLALTVECARVWVPLRDDIAAWVETGFGS